MCVLQIEWQNVVFERCCGNHAATDLHNSLLEPIPCCSADRCCTVVPFIYIVRCTFGQLEAHSKPPLADTCSRRFVAIARCSVSFWYPISAWNSADLPDACSRWLAGLLLISLSEFVGRQASQSADNWALGKEGPRVSRPPFRPSFVRITSTATGVVCISLPLPAAAIPVHLAFARTLIHSTIAKPMAVIRLFFHLASLDAFRGGVATAPCGRVFCTQWSMSMSMSLIWLAAMAAMPVIDVWVVVCFEEPRMMMMMMIAVFFLYNMDSPFL